MHGVQVPRVASMLALGWIVAVVVDRPLAVAAVVVAGLATPVLLVPRRRGRAAKIGAVSCGAAIAVLLVVTALTPTGAATLAAMVIWALAAAVALPAVYLVTFDDDPPETS